LSAGALGQFTAHQRLPTQAMIALIMTLFARIAFAVLIVVLSAFAASGRDVLSQSAPYQQTAEASFLAGAPSSCEACRLHTIPSCVELCVGSLEVNCAGALTGIPTALCIVLRPADELLLEGRAPKPRLNPPIA